MRILGFDTATRSTTVALCDVPPGAGEDGGPGRSRLELEGRDDPPAGSRPGHATRLLPLIVELLDRGGVGWEGIDRIAVGVGPGTFTGLRIGLATARALAWAREIPLVGVSTLESLALNGQRSAESFPEIDLVLAVIDARRGEVYAAGWPVGPPAAPAGLVGPPALNARVLAPEELAGLLSGLGTSCLALGDGAVEFRPVLESTGVLVPGDHSQLHKVTARSHCRLAGELRPVVGGDIRPEYLRLPDAEIARRAAGRQ